MLCLGLLIVYFRRCEYLHYFFFFFSSRRRHTRFDCDWSSDVCSSDLFLYKHPEVKPRVITHFEPWMALSFTEGSIGGDIERINPRDLATLYGNSAGVSRTGDEDELDFDPSGSNGIAIGPRLAANHHALLWINPHTSFYFRSELQMVSD